MKYTILTSNILIRLILLIMFVVFSFYKMKINLFYITIELLIFSFINSFIIKKKKIVFDMELFSFQAITVFYFEREANFYWREVPERTFNNYNYIKLLFAIIFIVIFIYLLKNKKNNFLRKYFCWISFILIVIENIFEIEIFSLFWVFTIFMSITFMYDIILFVVITIFLLKSDFKNNKNYFYCTYFIILSFVIRHITNTLGWGIL